MDEKIAAQPELYAASVEGDAVPTLKGGRCRACGSQEQSRRQSEHPPL